VAGQREGQVEGADESAPLADTTVHFRHSLRNNAYAMLALGTLACIVFVCQFSFSEALSVLGSAIVVAAAAGAIGAFLGFLFGIPKTLQSNLLDSGEGTRYLANTNLEQISDWLTKILVGIGLVQIARAPDALSSLADALAPAFGGNEASPTFALSLTIYSAVSAFVMTYLWTRALLRGVLQAADEGLSQKISDVLMTHEDANARALSLVEKQLAGKPVEASELKEALGKASPAWLSLIFRRAEEQRVQSWRSDKGRMEQAIPVFQALIALDPDRRFHGHFGSLGFCLKDKRPADYEGAIEQLTTAITIRGPISQGWPFYEWNRAVCRIRIDPQFGQQQKSSTTSSAEISQDLRTAATWLSPTFFQSVGADPDVRAVGEWLALNEVSL